MPIGPFGIALSTWSSWVGSAAADEQKVSGSSASLYELVRLDPALWVIVGVDLSIEGSRSVLVVYAFDRSQHGVSSHLDLLALSSQDDGLPVTRFELVGSAQDHLGTTAFESLAVRLVRGDLQDQRLVVRARRTLSITSSNDGSQK